ncbi:MAG: PAS domain S-box protein [Verrucomicrobia bacterium]|nr:MAG: PAS domain S-box protein [Verrucomicrobiota bacterium]
MKENPNTPPKVRQPSHQPQPGKPPHQSSAAAGVKKTLAAAKKAPEPEPVAGFPVIGIGASAGGLAAFEAFFSAMPATTEPGMAFVLVQHLAPDHKSLLAELIRRYTRMQVFEVEDGMTVQPNCAYIIPPNCDMAFLNGTLQLMEPSAPRGQRLPINFFFRSLAQDQRERAICIVLSGTGTDGTLGLRDIKGEGGMAMVQTPTSTEYDGMPRSAIATGLADYELPPAEMPAQLISYVTHAFGRSPQHGAAPRPEAALKKIFVLLRNQTGHDFSLYKPSTIHRRIERRMAVHQIEKMPSYVSYLQQTPSEVEALFRDLLINVTSFFRDAAAFKALEEQVIPKLLASKPAGSLLRVWSSGCSTGEEAYSIAILIAEKIQALKQPYTVQIFASDIDSQAVAAARTGLFPASISADITPERLARFFTAEPDGSGYRIHKSIREMLVFSEQDVIKNPPFSKLDLISCRNLLIYMNTELQKKVIPLFHYALNPGGFLFLGTSETIGEFVELFEPIERKLKIYLRKENSHGGLNRMLARFLPSMEALHAQYPQTSAKAPETHKRPWRELTEEVLLKQNTAVGILINSHGDILYLHGRSGMFLEPSPGEAGINNILKMARSGLRGELAKALKNAAKSGDAEQRAGLQVKTNGDYSTVNLTICPLPYDAAEQADAPLFLVILEKIGSAALRGVDVSPAPDDEGADHDEHLVLLKQQLRAKEKYLQTANEELERSNEELKSSNEEMQSVNEELQSSNEELETSKEELQSLNEELATVNTELQNKVADLSRSNNDMQNLLAGTGIATVFVDFDLRLLRFTPSATRIINLIPTDVGRPIGHIVSNLVGYDSLVADAREVLTTLIPKETEVRTLDDKRYTLRIMPYRTTHNVIEGGVITFVDITEIVATREALHKANDQLRLAVVVNDAHDAITVQDLDGRILAWNHAATQLYGWSEAEALLMNARDRIPKAIQADALAKIHHLSQAELLQPDQTQRLTKHGSVIHVSLISTALINQAGQMYAISTTERLLP